MLIEVSILGPPDMTILFLSAFLLLPYTHPGSDTELVCVAAAALQAAGFPAQAITGRVMKNDAMCRIHLNGR